MKKVESSVNKNKATAPADFFGSSKVKKDVRHGVGKAIVKKTAVSKVSSNEIEDFSDEEVFNDASFMQTLDEWDRENENKKSPKQKVSHFPFIAFTTLQLLSCSLLFV